MRAVGEIDDETNVCLEGKNAWLFFSTARKLIEEERQNSFSPNVSDNTSMKEGNASTYSSYAKTPQQKYFQEDNSQIAGAFRGVGIVCFVLAVVVPLLLLVGKNNQPIFAVALFLLLALSGLGWLGVGVIIRLLERIAENTGKK